MNSRIISLHRPRKTHRMNPLVLLGWGLLSVALGSLVVLVAVGYFHIKDNKLGSTSPNGKPDWIPSLVTIEIAIGVLASLHGLWILRMRRAHSQEPTPWGRDSWSSSWWRSRLRSSPKRSKQP